MRVYEHAKHHGHTAHSSHIHTWLYDIQTQISLREAQHGTLRFKSQQLSLKHLSLFITSINTSITFDIHLPFHCHTLVINMMKIKINTSETEYKSLN